MSESNIYILMVEDDKDMARLNTRLLKRQGYDVLVALTAAEASKLFREQIFNLIIIDIELPDGNGFSLCEEFRQDTDAPVLFLTGKTDTSDKVLGLSKGGDYYLTKPYDRDEFLAVVQSLLRREIKTQKKVEEVSVITRGSLTLRLHERKAYVDGRDAGLTPKEFGVLLTLVQNEDKEMTYQAIYESVWGTDMGGSSEALRKQISRLKKKLNEENTDCFAILSEYGKGYVFTEK